MKQINLSGKTLYALCAIDQYTRRPVVHVSSSCSSAAGKTALQKTKQRFTKDIIINDNGSENMGKAEQWLKEEQITQYWCRPNKPKDKLNDLSGRYRLSARIIITTDGCVPDAKNH